MYNSSKISNIVFGKKFINVIEKSRGSLWKLFAYICIYFCAYIILNFLSFYSYSCVIFSGCHPFAKTAFSTLHYHSHCPVDTFHLILPRFPLSSIGAHFLGDTGRLPESPHTRWYQKRSVVLSLRIYPSYSLLLIRESLYVPSLRTTLSHEPAHICAEESQWFHYWYMRLALECAYCILSV